MLNGATADNIDNNPFRNNIKNKDIHDDECPICFDAFTGANNLFCQTCGNVVHEKCIIKWLETRKDCIYCRSTVWANYLKFNEKNGKGENIINGVKYITL